MKETQNKAEKTTGNRVLTVVGSVLCVILVPMLIVNCILIVKSYTNTDEVPSIGGYSPLIVLTDSMLPEIESGDLIFVETVDASEIKVRDIISFFDPESNGTAVVTHEVIEVINENDDLSFRTKGTNNNTPDTLPVPAENLVGIYVTRIGGAGNVAMFLQTTPGLIVCIVIPVALFVGYELIRRRRYEKEKQDDTKALLAELEALRAAKASEKNAEAPAEGAHAEEKAEE